MIKYILAEANINDLKNFITDLMEELKERMPEVYKETMFKLHKNVYGSHFSKCLVEYATSKMENLDGTKGAKWSIDETNKILKDYNLNENEFDFNYVMNMMYSDYSTFIRNDTSTCVKLSSMFLDDPDAKEGKALRYFEAMCEDL